MSSKQASTLMAPRAWTPLLVCLLIAIGGMCSVPPATIGATSAFPNLPMPPSQLEDRLAYDDFTIRSAKGAGGGVMGAMKVELQFEQEPELITAKWKATGSGGDGWNNAPRREIGVYQVQAYFLDESDYLVPPTAARCIPLDVYRPIDDDAKPNLQGSRCEFGDLSAWLQNVKQPEKTFDRERFSADPAYALRFAQLNLLHYLVNHRDSRESNFLMSTDPDDPRIFSIDNGIAFGSFYNFFSWHYNEIRVPLPHAAIERLRTVSRQDLDRLGVLGQLETDAAGVLRNVPMGPNLDPEKGIRITAGRLQFGLTREEINAIAERLDRLLTRIDAGELPLL